MMFNKMVYINSTWFRNVYFAGGNDNLHEILSAVEL
jgi:hypothetical protein